jgi:hypothetical protein
MDILTLIMPKMGENTISCYITPISITFSGIYQILNADNFAYILDLTIWDHLILIILAASIILSQAFRVIAFKHGEAG